MTNEDGLTKRQLSAARAITRGRVLRNEAGEPEPRLWRALRQAFPSARFRRRAPIDPADNDRPYHAGFCLQAARPIAEPDGDDQAPRARRDVARTRFLQNEGYRLLRVGHAEVVANFDGVVAAIAVAVADKRRGHP